jgi:hypothetical protein
MTQEKEEPNPEIIRVHVPRPLPSEQEEQGQEIKARLKRFDERMQAKAMDKLFLEARQKIRADSISIKKKNMRQAVEEVLEEREQTGRQAFRELLQRYPLYYQHWAHRDPMSLTQDEIDDELAIILKDVYREHGEDGFNYLVQKFHGGDSTELSELMIRLELRGIDVRKE